MQRRASDEQSTPSARGSPYRGPSLALALDALKAGEGLSHGAGLAPARAAAASHLLALDVPGLPEVRSTSCPLAHMLRRREPCLGVGTDPEGFPSDRRPNEQSLLRRLGASSVSRMRPRVA